MGAILGYARVSKDDQDLSGQILRLEEAGASRIFQDKISGAKADRPGMAALMDYAREGDTLAVVRLDRLGRSLRGVLNLIEELKQRRIALRLLDQGIDTGTAGGELMLHLFGAVAEFERRVNRERTMDGLAAARKRGRPLGRAPADADKVEAAIKLVEDGMRPRAAAHVVGLGRSTVYRELAARKPADPASITSDL